MDPYERSPRNTTGGAPSRRTYPPETAHTGAGHHPIAFLFPGQGSQYPGMAADLYQRLPVFRREVDRCAETLRFPLGHDLREDLFPTPERRDEAAAHLRRTEITQPAVFTISWALAQQWQAWGIEPEALLGHSVGELTAATCAGVFTLENALMLVAERGRLLAEVEPGAVLSVPLAEDDLVPRLGEELALAAVNGPTVCAVSGPEDAIAALEKQLHGKGVGARRLHTSRPFHSAAVEPVLERFRQTVDRFERQPPRIPFLSNVSGTWIRPEEATDPDYWTRHLRQTVRFGPAVEELLAEPARVLLEVGPGEVLSTLARQQPAARGRQIHASSRHPQDPTPDLDVLLRTLGRLWLAGVEPEFTALHGEVPRLLHLPTCPFEGQRHWLPRVDAALPSGSPGVHEKQADVGSWFYIPGWKRALPPDTLPSEPPDDADSQWLVVLDGAGFGQRWVRDRGDDTVAVRCAPGDEDAMLADLSSPLRGVVDLRALGIEDASHAAPEEHLLRLAQALGRHHRRGSLPLLIVTDGLFDVVGGDAHTPRRAALAGLAQVTSQEYPQVQCRVVDLPAELNDTAAEYLGRELNAPDAEPVTAWRGGHRWQRVYDPVRVEKPAASPLRAGGHYVLTGGLGHFGKVMARYLGQTVDARLTLLDLQPPAASLAEELELPASLLRTQQVDVADSEALEAALRAAVEQFGPPAGILHAAGAPADAYRTLAEADAEHLRQHLHPKVHGAAALAQALERTLGPSTPPPEFVLVTSSLASVLGGIGLGPFAAADAVLDHQRRPGWIAVNWEGWERLWAEEEQALLGQQQNALMMTSAEVVDAFERILTLRHQPQVVVATADLPARLAQWTHLAAATAEPAEGRRASAVDYRAPTNPVEARVAEVWQEVLGIERVGLDDDFFLFGGSSLSGLQILSQLRNDYDVELPLRSFFEARTVAGMAELVAAEQEAGEVDEARLAELLAEIEALEEEEVDTALEAEEKGAETMHE